MFNFDDNKVNAGKTPTTKDKSQDIKIALLQDSVDAINVELAEIVQQLSILSTTIDIKSDATKAVALADITSKINALKAELAVKVETSLLQSTDTTSENPVQNKVVTNEMKCFIVTPSKVGTKYHLTLPIASPLYAGFVAKVYLTSSVGVSRSNNETVVVTVNNTDYAIKVNKCGALIDLPSHLYNNDSPDAYSGVFDANITLELVYDGANFVIMGNPEVITYTSDTVSYRIKADGFIETHNKIYNNGTSTKTLPVAYTTTTWQWNSSCSLYVTEITTTTYKVQDWNIGTSSKPSSSQVVEFWTVGY